MSSTTKQPKLQSYCAALYEHMLANSVVEEELTVWRGKVTKVADDIGIPPGTYKRVMNQLTALHCIEQVERGFRGSQLTTVILFKPPTPDVWRDEISSQGLTGADRPAIMWARLENVERELERRLGKLDLLKALGEMQKQLDDNTKKIEELQQLNKES